MNPEPSRENASTPSPAGAAPCWNLVSLALPALALAIGIVALMANPSGRGDYAGALGVAVLLLLGVGAACVLGAVAAVVALIRGERLPWLTALGLLGNGVVVVPVLGLLMLA